MLKIETGKYYKHYSGEKVFVAFHLSNLLQFGINLFTHGGAAEFYKDLQSLCKERFTNKLGHLETDVYLLGYKLIIQVYSPGGDKLPYIDNYGFRLHSYRLKEDEVCSFISEWTEEDEEALRKKFCNGEGHSFLIQEQEYKKHQFKITGENA